MAERLKKVGLRGPLTEAVKKIRFAYGWSAQRLADEMGMSIASVRERDRGERLWELWHVERIRDLTGIDPYMLAYCLYYDSSKLSPEIQTCLKALRETWEKEIALMSVVRHRLPTSWW